MPRRTGGPLQIKTSPKQIATIVFLIVFSIVGSFMVIQWASKVTGVDTGVGDDDTIIIDTSEDYGTMLLQWQLKDMLTSTSLHSDVDTVDFWVGNSPTFDFNDVYIKTHAHDAATELSDQYFAPGSTVILHAASDTDPAAGGFNYYSSWFIMELPTKPGEEEKVYWFDYIDPEDPDDNVRYTELADKVGSTDFTYTLKSNWKDIAEETGFSVSVTGGTSPYWDIGVLKMWPRLTAATTDVTVTYTGTVLDAVTDGAANTSEGADGCGTTYQNGNELTGTTNTINIAIDGGVINCGFGKPLLYVKPSGEIVSREAFIIVYFNTTLMGHDYLVDHGWKKVSISTLYAGAAYYHDIPALLPKVNNKLDYDLSLWLDTSDCTAGSSSAGGITLIMAIGDAQDENALAMGVYSTANPTFYGMSTWGLDTPQYPTGPTITSGAATSAMVFAAVTAAA